MCDLDEAEQSEYFLWVEAERARATTRPVKVRPVSAPAETGRVPAPEPVSVES
jgi:hypothetical protein